MYDWGPLNGTAPHRLGSILLPAITLMGTGDVPSVNGEAAANALWNADPSFGNSEVNRMTPLLRWPQSGYTPNFLIPGRWTLSVPDGSKNTPCDLSHASVKVSRNGTLLNVTGKSAPDGQGLVWTLDGTEEGDDDTQVEEFYYQGELFGWARPNFEDDIVYHVVVDGIRVPDINSAGDELGDGSLYNGGNVTNGHLEYDVIGYDPDIPIVDPNNQSSLVNISTRSLAGDGSSTQIAGFIISGNAPRRVLIRAGGPYLAQFGVKGVLPDPVLTLYDGSNLILSNDDWSTDAANVNAATSLAGTLGFAADSADAAIVATLQPGHAYTAHLTGKNVNHGNAIVEVYDADIGAASQFINISTRSFVGTGENIQIGGFILRGTGPRRVLIRAGGPYLAKFAVANVLADPTLTVFQGQTKIAYDDNWGTDSAVVSSATQAVGVPAFDSGSKDAAIVLTLDPDFPYTAQVAGKNDTTGNAMIEIFQLP